MDPRSVDSVLTFALLGLAILLVGLPVALLILRRVTRPPFRITSFRWLFLAWACLLAASSVWKLSREALMSADEAGTDSYVRLAFLSLGILIILVIGMRYKLAFLSELRTGVLGLFFLFAFWGVATSLWSVQPAGTLYKASEYAAMLAAFALTVSLINRTIKNPQHRTFALKSIFDFAWFLIFLLILSVYLGMLVWPEYAIIRGYREGVMGFWIQGALPGIAANSVGHIGAVMGVVCIVRILSGPGKRTFYVPILLLSLVTMVLTQSRSPILAFTIAVAAILIASRRFGLLALSGVFLGVGLLTQYSHLILDFMRRNQTDENLASLTGRVIYWRSSFEAVGERPIGGYGANVGGRYVLQSDLGENASTVHSTWVEVLLDTGVVGLILFSVALCATWFWLFKIRSFATRNPTNWMLWLESLGVLTVLCVRSVFAVDLVWSWHVITFGVILVFVSVVRRQIAQETHASVAITQPVPAAWRRRSGVRG